jgi:dethiobiotin synthetase
MLGLFVTGTDTGVGKTFIGTALARALHERGVRVCARKPVESGCKEEAGRLIAADAEALRSAAGGREAPEAVCRYRLRHALSPELAARLEGIDFSLADLSDAAHAGTEANSFLLVEGAGGFYSPLARDGLNADLAERLELPVLLVVADRLGCLNHALLTLEAIERRRLSLAGIVLNRIVQAGDEQEGMDNTADLRRLTGLEPVLAGQEQAPVAAALLHLAGIEA